MDEQGLKRSHPLLKTLLGCGACWQRPGEHRQREQSCGQSPPLAQPTMHGVGVLLQRVRLLLQGLELLGQGVDAVA